MEETIQICFKGYAVRPQPCIKAIRAEDPQYFEQLVVVVYTTEEMFLSEDLAQETCDGDLEIDTGSTLTMAANMHPTLHISKL